MVIDTSVLLALYFDETSAAWAAEQLNAHSGLLLMSTVNLSECLIHLQDRQPKRFGSIQDELLGSGIEFAAPDVTQAQSAAAARLRFPLNLGDCFAYALARQRACPVMALDADFRRTDIDVLCPSP